MDPQPADHVLEIGCGPGAAAELIVSKLESGKLFAIDRSESGVDRTKRRNQKAVDAGRLVEALVAAGECVAVLPRFTAPAGDEVVLRPLKGVASGRHVCAILRPDRAQRLAVRRVLEALVVVAAGFGGRPAAADLSVGR